MNMTNCEVCTPFQTFPLSLKQSCFKLVQHFYNWWFKVCWSSMCIFVPDPKNPTVLETWYWWAEDGTSIDVNEQRQHLRDFSAVEEIAVLIVLGFVSAGPQGLYTIWASTDEGLMRTAAGRAPLISGPAWLQSAAYTCGLKIITLIMCLWPSGLSDDLG